MRLHIFYNYFTRAMKIFKNIVLFVVFYVVLIVEVLSKIPDPYKVLGIPRNSNEDQIKQGFKKRSKKYHPDRNKVDPRAKEKFEKVVNAYELLKDPERKKMYDLTGDEDPNAQQQGANGFGGFGGGGFGINIQDLMRQGFGGFGGHPGQGGQKKQQQGRRTTYSFSYGGGNGMRF